MSDICKPGSHYDLWDGCAPDDATAPGDHLRSPRVLPRRRSCCAGRFERNIAGWWNCCSTLVDGDANGYHLPSSPPAALLRGRPRDTLDAFDLLDADGRLISKAECGRRQQFYLAARPSRAPAVRPL